MKNVRKGAIAAACAAALGLGLAACSIWAVDENGHAPPPPAPPSAASPSLPAPAAGASDVQFQERPPTPPPAVQTTPTADPNEVVVRGEVERQSAPPAGDPRSVSERMADVRAWDDCVVRAQNAAGGDPNRPSMDSPEEVCRARLGMSNRNAIPDSRRPH